MDENKIVNVKALLYDADTDEVKRIISQTEDQEILYVYAYNYNWDNGFDIPQTVLDNKKCDLSIALLIFYRADGLSYLEDKTDNANLPQWYSFIKRLYDSILTGEYQSGEIEFKVPLSTELDIYFDGNYEVAGGLGSTIVADEWEKYEKN